MTSVLAGVIAAPPAGAGPTVTAAGSPLTLWYDEPASDWESRSLPIGNGAMGASVFGTVNTERLSFNEKTLWTGGPGSAGGYNFGTWEQPRPDAIASVGLTAGQRYTIRLQHTENGGEASSKLFWSSPNTPQQIVPSTQLHPAFVLNNTAPGITYTGPGH